MLKKTIKYVTYLATLTVVVLICLPPSHFNDPLSTVVFANDRTLIGALIADDGQWRFPESDSLPTKFKKCLIEFEDQHYYKHPGVNPLAILRATVQNISKGEVVSGGSTLTMQVIRLMRKGKARNLKEKLIEAILAVRLELYHTKEEILNFHASHAPFGGNVVGFEAACWRYYGRDPYSLSWAESATLAVLPNAPSLIYPGKNSKLLLDKRNRLLDKLASKGIISTEEARLGKFEELPSSPHPIPQTAPHLLTTLLNQGKRGKRTETTLDVFTQKRVTDVANRFSKQYAATHIFNCAVLVAEIESGRVLAYVGNSTTQESKQHHGAVDIIQASRSTGSILKPFLYALGMQDGQFMPNALIDDIPVFYAGYAPQNYSHQYDGMVPASRALSRSLNVPSVIMLKEYGIQRFHDRLRKMGMTTLNQHANHYGLSLILGGAEGKLWDITGMYASMGRILKDYPENGAKYSENDFRPLSFMQKKQVDGGETDYSVLEAGTIWHTLKAMEEVHRPENEQGWRLFSSSRRVAWKTGTSFGYRDAWAVGMDAKYVVGVWVGNADGSSRHGLVGVQKAAPILFDVFKTLPTSEWYACPYEDLERTPVCRESGFKVGQFCDHADTILAPLSSRSSTSCKFHQNVTLSSDGQYRVHSSCEALSNTYSASWFAMSPVQEWYFKRKHAWYEPLPPLRDDCQSSDDRIEMQFIYPKQFTKIKVPRELDGNKGAAVFKLAHKRSGAKVYWYLGEVMLEVTEGKHQIELSPDPGNYMLTVVDDFGNSLTKKLEFQ